MRPEEEESIDPQKLTGMVLVGIGAMALLFIIISVVPVIRKPSEADLIQWMSEAAGGNTAVLSGNFGNSEFNIQANEPFQIIFLCIIGLIILRLITSIFVAFIKSGTALMAKAEKTKEEKAAKRASTPPKLRFPPND